jgi:hypothetical protein
MSEKTIWAEITDAIKGFCDIWAACLLVIPMFLHLSSYVGVIKKRNISVILSKYHHQKSSHVSYLSM